MSELLEVLTNINPWWQEKKIGKEGIEREMYLGKIKKYLPTEEILVLKGIRRSGKTTLLKQTIKNLLDEGTKPEKIFFVNFDEPDINNLEEPLKSVLKTYEQEVNSGEAYLFLDEIQHVDGWEKTIKALYDRGKHKVIITGSSSKLLKSKLGKLLSGRYLSIEVTPLSFKEYLRFHQMEVPEKSVELAANKNKIMNKLRKYLTEGGFPRVVLEEDEELKKQLLSTYYESILYRDVLLAHEVRHNKALKELIYYLITNFTSPYTYKKISNNLGLDFNTLKDYIGYLTESGIIKEVNYFSYSLKAQGREPKKPYCVDNGLRNSVSFKFSDDYGRLAENLVFNSLNREKREVYYWKNRKEVDFVAKGKDDSLEAINVTYTNQIKEREVKALMEFEEKYGGNVKKLTLITKDLEKKEKGIDFVPLWKWLLRKRKS